MSKQGKKNWSQFKEEHDQEERSEARENEEVTDTAVLDHPSYTALEAKLTEAEQRAHENWEKSVRAMAELDNVRRRTERTANDSIRFALTGFVTALLPVVDSLEQAIQMADKKNDASMKEGLELTLRQFLAVLEKNEVTFIDPEGLPFDPLQHEAMSMQEDEGPANRVLAVFQKGYSLHDRVIRPARVIVSKAKN